jgi:hypothetical protein
MITSRSGFLMELGEEHMRKVLIFNDVIRSTDWVRMVRWPVNNELEREEAIVSKSEVLSRNLPGGTEEDHGALMMVILCAEI